MMLRIVHLLPNLSKTITSSKEIKPIILSQQPPRSIYVHRNLYSVFTYTQTI